MCGIFCAIIQENNVKYSVNDISKCLNSMYENCMENIRRRGPDYQHSINIQINNWHILLSSSVLWLQGLKLVQQPIETYKSWFLYNGDIFDNHSLPINIRETEGDTKPLLRIIENSECLFTTLKKIQGPYAFIYINKTTSRLYFGRDIYGRRSLLISKDKEKLVLSSVTSRELKLSTIELPSLGIFCIDLNKNLNSMLLYPWNSIESENFKEKLGELEKFLSIKITIVGNGNNTYGYDIPNEKRIAVVQKIEKLHPKDAFTYIMSDKIWKNNVLRLNSLLEDAVERRVKNQPQFCSNCIKETNVCNHVLIGILFSGGLDCAIISLIADKFIDKSREIDLLNVAFEKGNNYDTPDRITARQTFEELQLLRPERKWNLIEINITQKELCEEREKRIADLIYPLRSILDESLGCALWFASRGQTENYISPCRVLFVGMGADELFGGYTRHRAAYKRGGWNELTRELIKDWRNISYRNLARDDRVVADHGRQLRTPYLDENVAEFVLRLNPWEKCYPSENTMQGLGDKLLLRTLGFHLGLTKAAVLRKRALQFGSRIANSKENAHEVSPRL